MPPTGGSSHKKGNQNDQLIWYNFVLRVRCVPTEKFSKGDLPLEYKGELVSEDKSYQREDLHGAELRSFLFFFKDGFKSLR